MTPALLYFLKRLKPFFLLFILCETLSRLVLTGFAWNDIADARAALPLAMLAGFAFDLCVFAWFCVPLGLFYFLLPTGKHGLRADRVISTCLFFLIAYVLMFSVVSEYFFWDEFQSRFNFIAVDYLVYTQEVIGNIRESYPVNPILAAIAVLSAGAAWQYSRGHKQGSAPAFAARAGAKAVILAVTVLSFVAMKSTFGDVSDNRYLNEVARNGIYELFSAFRHNELSYNKFLLTMPEDKLKASLRSQLGLSGEAGASPLDRKVTAASNHKPYNLVIITVESLSALFLGTFGNTQGLTPHLDKLADESLLFTNLYATGTRTVYGLAAISLAMPPVPGNAIVRQKDNGGLATLGGVLKKQGYATKFIYGGYGYFDNMNEFFSANGYEIVDRSVLAEDEIHFANVWGVADDDIYHRTIKENDKEAAAGRPFFDMIMTTSNHRPFTYPDGKIDIPSHAGRAGGVKFTDYAINDFLTEAKKHDWFNNTVFVIVADHTAGSAGKSELDPEKYHIPMIIYAPGIVKPGKVDWMASQIDIAPTVLGLMGADYDSRFYGVDLIKEKPGRAFVSNYEKLGYLTEDGLVILSPVRRSSYLEKKGDAFVPAAKVPEDALNTAITYYQGASQWRNWSKLP